MATTIITTTTITVAIMLLLTTHPLTWLGSWQAPLGRAAVSPHYQVDKHYDDYDNYSGYSETDGVSRHPYLPPHSSAQRTLRPTPRIAQRPAHPKDTPARLRCYSSSSTGPQTSSCFAAFRYSRSRMLSSPAASSFRIASFSVMPSLTGRPATRSSSCTLLMSLANPSCLIPSTSSLSPSS